MRLIIIAGTALLALAGCGGAAPEAGGGNLAAPAEGSLTSADGRSEVRSDAAFSGLPEGIPAYPRIRPGGAIQMGGADDGAEMRIMGFRTDDPPADVIAFYAAAAARAGFREGRRASPGPSEVMALERANGIVMNVTATGTPSGTSVQIMTGRERARR